MIALNRIRVIAGVASLVLVAELGVAQTDNVTFPDTFDQFVLYATYDRGASREEAFALPETIEWSKSGLPLPPGTQIVLGIWNNYALTDYFVMEKGEGWGLLVSEDLQTGDWHFQQFDPNMQVRRTSFAERCQSCHQGAADNDYMFTIDRMRDYLP